MGAKAIGQVDRKYILLTTVKEANTLDKDTPCKGNDTRGLRGESDAALGYIVVADQHAVDERVRLENMAASYNAMQVPTSSSTIELLPSSSEPTGERRIQGKCVQLEVKLNARFAQIATQSQIILEQWRFIYTLPQNWREMLLSSSTSTCAQTVLCTLTSVPLIMDVPLKAADFIEFLESLSSDRGLEACRPP